MSLNKLNYVDQVTVIPASNLNEIQDAIIELEGDVGEIETEIEGKADADSVYTKTEADALLNAKADSSAVYTKTETDTLLSGKASASDLEELEEEVTDYRQMYLDSLIHTTASGSIASFSDGFKDAPMDSCTASIEPVQDLHGYANPWPAGGGKNLLDKSSYSFVNYANIVWGGTAQEYADGSFNLRAGTYTFSVSVACNGLYVSDAESQIAVSYNGTHVTFTVAEDKAIKLMAYKSGVTQDDLLSYNYQLEAGSTATEYAPYSNICPISGFTGAEVVRTGKNLLKTTLESQTKNGITYTVNDDGSIRVQGTATAISIGYIGNCIIREDATYYASGCPSGGAASTYRMYCSWGVNEIGNGSQRALTEGTLVYLQISIASGVTIDATFKPMLCKLSSGTDYEPYTADTYSVTWESEAGTVYGGNVDLVSGVLTVTHGYIASYNGETLPSTWISDRDVYAEGTTPTIGAEVVYELATPTTYQLTPQEVTTLLGSNNVWADTGDTSVGYVANTKLYIDSRI